MSAVFLYETSAGICGAHCHRKTALAAARHELADAPLGAFVVIRSMRGTTVAQVARLWRDVNGEIRQMDL